MVVASPWVPCGLKEISTELSLKVVLARGHAVVLPDG